MWGFWFWRPVSFLGFDHFGRIQNARFGHRFLRRGKHGKFWRWHYDILFWLYHGVFFWDGQSIAVFFFLWSLSHETYYFVFSPVDGGRLFFLGIFFFPLRHVINLLKGSKLPISICNPLLISKTNLGHITLQMTRHDNRIVFFVSHFGRPHLLNWHNGFMN